MFGVAFWCAFEEGFVFAQVVVRVEVGGELVEDACPVRFAVVAGVGDEQFVAVGDGAAAVSTVTIPVAVGGDAGAVIGVVDEVGAAQVAPVFEAVYRAEREPLVEEVVGTLPVAEAVGVVEQAGRWLDMVVLPPRAGLDLGAEGFVAGEGGGGKWGVAGVASPGGHGGAPLL